MLIREVRVQLDLSTKNKQAVLVKDEFFYAECPLACHYFSDRHFGAVKVDFEAWIHSTYIY